MAHLKALLERNQPFVMSWSMMPGPLGTEVLARGNWDGCCIDLQHGYIGYRDYLVMAAPIIAGNKPLIARMPIGDWGMAGKLLDAGAQGLISPMINNRDDAEAFVQAAKFPPLGGRSFGAYRDASVDGAKSKGHLQDLNRTIFTFAMVETTEALDNIDEICATDGIDGVFVGPNDLSVSLTNGQGPVETQGPAVMEAMDLIVAACQKNRVIPGTYSSTPDQSMAYQERGFTLFALGSDISFLSQAGAASLAAFRP